MPQLDVSTYATQVFWLAITFTTLFIIMWKVAIPKIINVLEARQDKIDSQLNRAETLKKEAEAAMAAYEASLTEARTKAAATVTEAAAKIAELTHDSETELAQRLNKKLSDSEKAIDKAKNDALKDMRTVAVEVAQSATEKLIGETIDSGLVNKAVDDALS